jgi:hypothetical protein
VTEYLATGNATEAAKRAGYSQRTAYSQGQRLLKNVEVKKLLRARLDDEEVVACEVLRELKRIAFADRPDEPEGNCACCAEGATFDSRHPQDFQVVWYLFVVSSEQRSDRLTILALDG